MKILDGGSEECRRVERRKKGVEGEQILSGRANVRTFTEAFVVYLKAFTDEVAKFSHLTTLTLVFRKPLKLGKFRYSQQYPKGSDRCKVVADKFYHHLVQAATKANQTSAIKKICLGEQLSRVCKTDKSLRIKCAAEHVFEY
jgi:hypothetical protein